MVEIIAGWEPDGSNGAAHRQWPQDLWQSLASFALPGGYANSLATPLDREKAGNAYGSNGARLRSLKRRFDPDGVFAFRDSVARPALSCEGVEEPHHWSSVADTAVRTPLLFAPRHDSSGTAKRKR